MEKEENPPLKEKLINWLAARFEQFESILVVATLAIILAKELLGAQIEPLLIVSLGTLAYMYFLLAFASINSIATDRKEIAFHKLTLWSCAIGILGILFHLMKWENPNTMLTVSSATLAISLAAILYFKNTKATFAFANNRYLLRAVAICLMGISILLT